MTVATKGKFLKEMMYPISLNYGKKDWNMISALRELLSNMLDTQTTHEISHEKGMAIISDDGDGLPMKSFVFGESSRNDSQIGQFGEGLKMAFITLLRENRKVWVETVGFNVEVLAEEFSVEAIANEFDLSTQYVERKFGDVVEKSSGTKVMKLRFYANEITKGTRIYAECTEAELTEAKNLFLALNDIQKVDTNVYLPAGDIFIVGLKTTSLPNMLFSYNIPDKSMTNRDRNIVDTTKLMNNLVRILEGTKNQRFMKVYLTAFEKNPNAYEYQLAFRIPHAKLDTWKKAFDQQYPKACLSSDLKSDLYASAMGYTVLRNVPHHLLQVFKQLGVKDSSLYASSYKGEALQAKNKLIYPIGEDYVKEWTRSDAIRELIANALDAGEPRISHNGEEARISDSGDGIMKKHLVLGASSKTQDDIGKFGEGLKMGVLVLARTGSPVTIESIGTTYECKLEYQEEFQAKLLVIEHKKNARTKGTSIVFTCKPEELEATKERFIQFQGIRKKPISSTDGKLDVYLDQKGELYIQGVKTTTIRSLFGYNVKDNNVLNGRDRNNYNTAVFNQYLVNMLEKTDNQDLMELFLSAWRDSHALYSVEYQVSFFPKSYTAWTKLAKKLFPKACFTNSGGGEEDDFIARCAGYTLLSNVPSAVRNILEKAGIGHVSTIASKYRNKGIQFEDKIVYPITSSYGSNWSVQKAMKELLSNALDADKKCSVSFEDGQMVIKDKGEGISKQNLLFGSTSKSETDTNIGLFGEGLKMASLVLARNKRQFKLITKGFEYTATIERDAKFGADVLVIHLSPSRKRIGTDIYVQATEDEVNSVKSAFLTFNKKFEEVSPGILVATGYKNCVFVNGVFIAEMSSALFSYNTTNKLVMGRDRSQLDMDILRTEVRKLWAKCEDKKTIEKLLTSMKSDHYESQIEITPSSTAQSAWKAVVTKLYGKSCFSIGTEHDQVAKDRGFNLILQTNPGLVHILGICGIKSSDQVVTLRGDEGVVYKRYHEKDLSTVGKRRWDKSKKIFSELYGTNVMKRLEIIEFQEDTPVLGMYLPATDMIYISKTLIEQQDRHSFEELMGTMIHEQIHRKTQAHDCTRSFEKGLSDELGRIASLLFKGRKQGA